MTDLSDRCPVCHRSDQPSKQIEHIARVQAMATLSLAHTQLLVLLSKDNTRTPVERDFLRDAHTALRVARDVAMAEGLMDP